MSKRFGRNQKRRMRETIANLEQARTMDAGPLRNQGSELSQARDALERVEKLLGEYTAALPPKRINGGREPVDTGRFGLLEHSARLQPSLANQNQPIDSLVSSVKYLSYVVANTDTRPDFGMHVIVDFAGRRAAYAATNEAIANTRKLDLIQRISESIAVHLAHELSDKPPRGQATTRW